MPAAQSQAMLKVLLEAMRPHQWVKNLLVLAPLVFAHKLGEPDAIWRALAACAAFCLVASAVYLLNDVLDREADCRHAVKRQRPVASGRLPVRVALLAGLGLGGGGLGLALALDFLVWPVVYVALNVAYSFTLKHRVILDCLCIALGFVVRVHAGAVAIDVATSSWILLCTFFFALFLAFCKRREEVSKHSDGSGTTRAALRDYDMPFLDQMIAPLAALAILTYALYTIDPATERIHGTRNLLWTVPVVTFGIFRYLFLVHRRGAGADPARVLFNDRQLLLSGALYAGVVYAAL
jgi:4-hydroxybenzoate polyprenyltransferase